MSTGEGYINRITFLIPYYRGLEYLDCAIRSLIAQSNPYWQAIVVDDRGEEDAEDFVRQIADERLSYVRNEMNLGLARNWNKAMSLAHSEFATILHSDDELEPNYTDVMLSLMDRHPGAIAGHCRTSIIGPDGQKVTSLPDMVKTAIRPHSNHDSVLVGAEGLLSITKGAWIFCPTLCYRKTMFPTTGFDDSWKFALDVDLMAKVLFSGGTIVGTSEVAYRYRRHVQNQTAILTESTLRFEEELRHLDEVADRASQLGWEKVARTARRRTVVRLHLVYQALRALIRSKVVRAATLFALALRGQPK